MINRRLVRMVPGSIPLAVQNVLLQWGALAGNIVMMLALAGLVERLVTQTATPQDVVWVVFAGIAAGAVGWCCTVARGGLEARAAALVKTRLRSALYEKLLQLGPAYTQKSATAEVVQLATEGVEQLETYFSAYLPQLIYSLLAPITLFAVLSFFSLGAAGTLLACVPLIPVAIAVVQTFAKKLLTKYWDSYTALADTFLENLQGLVTLKIYSADEARHQRMNREAEQFRRITMRVLTMQLNSITIMDLVAYGGAALGITLAVRGFVAGTLSPGGCFAVLLLAAEFFLPMRRLGSLFHIAMNGMAASGKIFALLDLPLPQSPTGGVKGTEIECRGLCFSYDDQREAVHGLNLTLPLCGMVALTGESGSGKSTVAAILAGQVRGYCGSVLVGGSQLSTISPQAIRRTVTYVGPAGYLFAGTVRDNLKMANPAASDAQLWQVLQRARIALFLQEGQGLETSVLPHGANFSGGQRQRLAFARALLHDTPIYIFDEATANIDVESERDLLHEINELAKTHAVLVISHRLAGIQNADCIYVLRQGRLVGHGTHAELLTQQGDYAQLWCTQQALEQLPNRRAVN